jgi:hypothetical protein
MHSTSESKRVVFTTWGSYGDIHPFMGLSLELQERGHRPAIGLQDLIFPTGQYVARKNSTRW